MTITLIAAVSQNGVIGHNGTIPWDLPADRAHFARTTKGGVVILGRKTWESIQPRGLPGRRVIVLTRSRKLATGYELGPSIYAGASLDEALSLARFSWEDLPLFIAGGAEVYAEALPIADAFILSRIMRDYEGDTLFPDWYQFRWAPTGLHDWDWHRAEWQTSPGAPIPWRIEHWRRDVANG